MSAVSSNHRHHAPLTSSPKAVDRDVLEDLENKTAATHSVMTDEQLLSELLDLKEARSLGKPAGWTVTIVVWMALVVGGDKLSGVIQGDTFGPMMLSAWAGMSALVLVAHGLPIKLGQCLVQYLARGVTPRCPACDAAWMHELRYECSSCEAQHDANSSKPWHEPCPNCRIRPDAVFCWRCKQAVRLHKDTTLRAFSILCAPKREVPALHTPMEGEAE